MHRVRHAARIAVGYLLLVIGVIGLFLPVIQGVLLIIAGATMLGWDLKKIKDARNRAVAWWRRTRGAAGTPPEPREGPPPRACRAPGAGAQDKEPLRRGE